MTAPQQQFPGIGRGCLEPATQQFVDSLEHGLPIHALNPAKARDLLVSLQSGVTAKPPARIEDTTFPVGPTGSVSVRIVRPAGGGEVLPVVMHFHGGGWMLGDKDTHDRLSREIAVGAHAVLFFVDHDRSPEARYPTAIEQAYAATQYVVEHGGELGVDATRLALFGEEAGGNIVAAVTLLAKERRGPKIDFQVLFCPVTDSNFDTPSYASFEKGPWLTKQAMELFWDAYLPDKSERSKITASPLNASTDELRGLPDALVIVGENDVLRDEGEAYARKLSEAGVRVTSVRYNGTVPDFVLLNALADTPAARAAVAQAAACLRLALG